MRRIPKTFMRLFFNPGIYIDWSETIAPRTPNRYTISFIINDVNVFMDLLFVTFATKNLVSDSTAP